MGRAGPAGQRLARVSGRPGCALMRLSLARVTEKTAGLALSPGKSSMDKSQKGGYTRSMGAATTKSGLILPTSSTDIMPPAKPKNMRVQ